MHLPTILHVTEAVKGGVASYVADLLADQTTSGDLATVILAGDPARTTPEVTAAAPIFAPYPTTRSPLKLARTLWGLRRIITAYQPHIIHAHSTFPGVYVRLLKLFGQTGRAKIVYCPHGWSFDQEQSALKNKVFRTIEKALAPLSDATLAISKHEAILAAKLGIPHDNIWCLPSTIPDLPPQQPLEIGRKAGHVVVGFVGRFDRQKGFDLLSTAFTSLTRTDLQLVAAGGADRGDTAVSIPPAITQLGWLARADIARFMASIDILVVPSRWEGFGLVVLEAFRAGTPVLCSNRGALPSLVQHGVNGYVVDINDPNGLKNTLENLSSSELKKMRTAARARFEHLSLTRNHRAETRAGYASLLIS